MTASDLANKAVDLVVAGLEHGAASASDQALADAAAAVEDGRVTIVEVVEASEDVAAGNVDPVAITATVADVARTVVEHVPGAAPYLALVDLVLQAARAVAFEAARFSRRAAGDHVVEVDLRGQ